MHSNIAPQHSEIDRSKFPNGTWLMCRPDHFDIAYEINPWMKVAVRPKAEQAWRQWLNLHHTMLRLGAWIEYVSPTVGQPDMVFTANAGLIKGQKCVLSKFRYAERQGEEAGFKRWFEANGFEVLELKTGSFEGEGDALFCGDTLFMGYPFRSDLAVQDEVAGLLGITKFVGIELVDPYFYHLDTCFCPLPGGRALYFPDAFSEESRKKLNSLVELHPVPIEEARRFACNAVLLGSDIIIPAGSPVSAATLTELGFTPHQVELGEYIKSGGAAKCLTNRIA